MTSHTFAMKNTAEYAQREYILIIYFDASVCVVEDTSPNTRKKAQKRADDYYVFIYCLDEQPTVSLLSGQDRKGVINTGQSD